MNLKPKALAITLLAISMTSARAQEKEVTLFGNAIDNFHTREKDEKVILYAFGGTPEVAAEFEKIVAGFIPEKGLDMDGAVKLSEQFDARLRYFIRPGEPMNQMLKLTRYGSAMLSITGAVEEKDGRKWINVSKWEQAPGVYSPKSKFKYPEKMLAPDKPFVMPAKDPLILKISDTLTLKCIWVPPGKFLMGEPFYMNPHWAETPPHRVTLTKGFYMAEHPITLEMYEAVVGATAAPMDKNPKAVLNASCDEASRFCKNLSEKTGKKIRIPTAAEWEFAARVGTSNPPFKQKYSDQVNAVSPMLAKAKSPNPWGFYDMTGIGWERVSDGTSQPVGLEDVVDPRLIPKECLSEETWGAPHKHKAKGTSGYSIDEFEFISNKPYGPQFYPKKVIRCRIVVEE